MRRGRRRVAEAGGAAKREARHPWENRVFAHGACHFKSLLADPLPVLAFAVALRALNWGPWSRS